MPFNKEHMIIKHHRDYVVGTRLMNLSQVTAVIAVFMFFFDLQVAVILTILALTFFLWMTARAVIYTVDHKDGQCPEY